MTFMLETIFVWCSFRVFAKDVGKMALNIFFSLCLAERKAIAPKTPVIPQPNSSPNEAQIIPNMLSVSAIA